MKNILWSLTLLLTLPWSGWLHAQASFSNDEYMALIEEYVDKAINIYDGTWAYSYTTRNTLEEESETRRLDPSQPPLLYESIIAVNGEPPSAERVEKHERRMQRRLKRKQRGAGDRSIVDEEKAREGEEKARFLSLIIQDSLQLVHREGNLHTLEFRGMEEDRKNIYEHLVGRLVLDTEKGFIRELQVEVTEPFSPFIFMRIHDGYYSMRFALRDGIPIQTDATWRLAGQILYLKDLDREREINWFDIRRVTPWSGH